MSLSSPDGNTIRQFQNLYRVDGVRYDRLSTILSAYPKGGLEIWQRKKGFTEADRIRDRSAAFGKVAHGIVEALNKEEAPDIGSLILEHDPRKAEGAEGDPELGLYDFEPSMFTPYADGYADWKRKDVLEIIFVEQTVWSTEDGWAGTDDFVYLLKDNRVIVGDLKTSKSLGPAYRLQTVAYGDAFLERGWLPRYDGREIIQMSSEGHGLLRVVPYDEPVDTRDADREAFHHLLGVFRYAEVHKDEWKK